MIRRFHPDQGAIFDPGLSELKSLPCSCVLPDSLQPSPFLSPQQPLSQGVCWAPAREPGARAPRWPLPGVPEPHWAPVSLWRPKAPRGASHWVRVIWESGGDRALRDQQVEQLPLEAEARPLGQDRCGGWPRQCPAEPPAFQPACPGASLSPASLWERRGLWSGNRGHPLGPKMGRLPPGTILGVQGTG